MEPIRTYSHRKICLGLDWGIRSASIILKSLGLTGDSSHKEFETKVWQDLKDMKYEVKRSDTLTEEERSVPALVRLNTTEKKDGGLIKLNRQFPTKILREALFHEYAHIKDEKLPILTTDKHVLNNRIFWDEFQIEIIEFLADMVAYSLIMPPAQLRKNLWTNAYDVDKILDIYRGIEKNSVLGWIALNSHFPCHFVSIVFKKDKDGKTMQRVVNENSFYDHELDPSLFDIESVLNNPESAASTAIKNQDKAKKESIINNTKYFCYAYYESNLQQVVVNNIFPQFGPGTYDRLLFIGWRKAIFEQMQNVSSFGLKAVG
jgi:hypothetical protein